MEDKTEAEAGADTQTRQTNQTLMKENTAT